MAGENRIGPPMGGRFAFRRGPSSGLALAFGAGVLLGSVWFFARIARRIGPLGAYAVASVSAAADIGRFRDLFEGRPISFLGQQWALRVGVASLVLSAVALLGHAVRRPAALGGRLLRGVHLEDRRGEIQSGRRIRVLLSSTLAALAVFGAAMATFGERAPALPDYATTYLASSWPALARLLSPDGLGETIWLEVIEVPGFYSPSRASAAYRAQFGFSFPEIAGLLAAKLVLLGGVFFGAFAIIERRTRTRADAYRVAGVEIPPGRECYHVLVCGSPGSGKSTAIKDLLDQIRARGERAIVYDVAGEYVDAVFSARGRQASQSTRCAKRNLDPLGRHQRAGRLRHAREEPLPSWRAGAFLGGRLGGLVRFGGPGARAGRCSSEQRPLRAPHPTAARRAPPGAREHACGSTPRPRGRRHALEPHRDGDKPTSSVVIAAGSAARRTRILHPEIPGRSLGRLALPLDKRAPRPCPQAASLPLGGPRSHHAPLVPRNGSGPDVLVLDEVASLQRLPALAGLLERGRKHGAAVVLGLQAMPQLRHAYGPDLAAALVAQPQTWLVLRTVEPDTAKWLERALGIAEVEEMQESYSVAAFGLRAGGDRVSVQQRTVQQPVALASEIAGLPDHEGFLRLPGNDTVLRVRSVVKARPPIAAPFVPRSGAPTTAEATNAGGDNDREVALPSSERTR